MIRVKVCGMRDAFNIREISDALPDFMGFIFFRGSKRYIGDNPDPGLFSGIPSDIKKVGVFVDENNRRIIEIASMAGLTAVQLHGNETTESCNELKASGLTVIKTFNIGPDFRFNSLEPYSECCDFFLFDTKSETAGGSGKKFGWQRLEEYSLDKPFFLSGGIGPEDSITIRSLHNKGLFAADINSRFEISPGLKDVALVKAFINKIKEDSYDL